MFLTALVFLLILSVLVLVHEIGHFVAAKKMGIKVEEFGFGLPPKIFGIRRGETTYSVNWLPIGGFVKLFGEEGEEEIKNQKSKIKNKEKFNLEIKNKAFYTRPVWQRTVVLVAGVAMNFLLAITVISYIFTQGVMVPTDRVHIEKILANSPAERAGLKEKDIIKKFKVQSSKFKSDEKIIKTGDDLINKDTSEVTRRVYPVRGSSDGGVNSIQVEETEIKNGEQLIETTKKHLGEEVTLVIERGGQELGIAIVPRKDYPKDEGPMGVVISRYEEKKYPFWQAPVMGMKESLFISKELVWGIGKTIWKLISFQPVGKDVAGPIGIAQMTGAAVRSGENAVLELLGLLSLNLAIVNILPFPALDGGRLLFVLIEGITGKKIKTHWERYIHQFGMIILLALMILVTLND
ncbi:RIP metalloprotease RseP, partial [Candidatus Gottesmanbacteria bacterium]|nr:RIP metalloprotease RseP [Candidatus Gottesmanbacteria bacterium]